MAEGTKKSEEIPVLEIGVPVKKDQNDQKDRGTRYTESLESFKRSNPNNEKQPELRKEINSHLSAGERQSLEYLKLKALNVQTAIEKAKGPHNAERGVFVIEKKGKNEFSLTSFGQTTEFHYINEGDSEKFSFIPPGGYRIVTNNPEEMIRLINFVNFSKDFIKDNMQDISSQSFYASRSFYENNGDILFANETNKRGVKVLKSEHNFFPQSTREVVSYLNSLYREELYNQKNGPFLPK